MCREDTCLIITPWSQLSVDSSDPQFNEYLLGLCLVNSRARCVVISLLIRKSGVQYRQDGHPGRCIENDAGKLLRRFFGVIIIQLSGYWENEG